MVERRQTLMAGVPAAILALLTLSVFALAQNDGPQSTVGRFHRAVALRDLGTVRSLVAQPLEDPSVGYVVSTLTAWNASGARVESVRVVRRDRWARVSVAYRFPRNEVATVDWILVRSRSLWQIDCRATLEQAGPYRGSISG